MADFYKRIPARVSFHTVTKFAYVLIIDTLSARRRTNSLTREQQWTRIVLQHECLHLVFINRHIVWKIKIFIYYER